MGAIFYKDIPYGGGQGDVSEDLLKDTVGWTGKNLANVDDTQVGVAWNGTSNTGRATLYIPVQSDEKYYITYDASVSTLDSIYYATSTNIPSENAPSELDANPKEIPVTTGRKYIVLEFRKTNITLDDIKAIKLMVRYNNIADDAYRPYHYSVKQTLRDAEVIEGKNLLRTPYDGTVSGSSIFTVNTDGSITIDAGTYSARSDFYLETWGRNFIPKAGRYILSLEGMVTDVSIRIEAYSGNTWVRQLINVNNPSTPQGTVTIDYSDYDRLVIYVNVGANATLSSNVIVKPMLRDVFEEDPTFEPYYIPLKDSKPILPTPAANVEEANVVSAVNGGLNEGGINNDVASLYGIGKWSNTMTKTYYVQGIAGSSTPIGRQGIGTWNVDGSDETGWITIPLLVGIGSLDHDIKITYDPAKSGMILKGGYIIDDTTGKMAIKFANTISEADTHTARIGIEITIKRTENNPVSFTS